MRRLARFLALPLWAQRDLAEAALCLFVARLLLFLPFRWLVRLIGRPQAIVKCGRIALATTERPAVRSVRQAILRVALRLPWRSSCLVRALAARMMLKRRGLPSALQLGVKSETARGLAAHAWLKCGEIDVVGSESATEFTPIAVFDT